MYQLPFLPMILQQMPLIHLYLKSRAIHLKRRLKKSGKDCKKFTLGKKKKLNFVRRFWVLHCFKIVTSNLTHSRCPHDHLIRHQKLHCDKPHTADENVTCFHKHKAHTVVTFKRWFIYISTLLYGTGLLGEGPSWERNAVLMSAQCHPVTNCTWKAEAEANSHFRRVYVFLGGWISHLKRILPCLRKGKRESSLLLSEAGILLLLKGEFALTLSVQTTDA